MLIRSDSMVQKLKLPVQQRLRIRAIERISSQEQSELSPGVPAYSRDHPSGGLAYSIEPFRACPAARRGSRMANYCTPGATAASRNPSIPPSRILSTSEALTYFNRNIQFRRNIPIFG
jgi:hypothetical protein